MTLVASSILVRPRKRWVAKAVISGAIALAAVSGVYGVKVWRARAAASAAVVTGKFYAVTPIDFDVKVVKDGELAAVNNIDILNLVEGQSTIVQIVKEG